MEHWAGCIKPRPSRFCAVGAVLEWSVGIPGGAVLCLIIAVGAGWYDYRVWTFKARRFLL